ncbi:MAG: hypothetical protein DRH90_25540 [Deltaproteobacteria bacterium]|nr:MAG: hypothetical protein DRH90_25540 [Deltaproteobacteria bacterium]
MSKEIEIPMQKILQDVEDQVQAVKDERARIKSSCTANLAELEKLLNVSNDENSEEQEAAATAAETVA